MAFLLGAFGKSIEYCKPLLRDVVNSNSRTETLHISQFENGIIFAGYKKEETIDYLHDLVIPIPNDQGVLVGRLFDSTSYKPVEANATFAQKVIDDPQKLCTLYWGRYAGVLFNKKLKALNLVRDPQGLFQFFYTIKKDLIIFSTELSLLYDSMDIKPELDLSYFAEYIIATNNALPTTPFDGVSALLPGTTLRVDQNGTSKQSLLWDPSSLHGTFIKDTESFEEELLATMQNCIKSWVADAPGVSVKLSGGTDSSGIMLLLASIVSPDKKLIAVNFMDSNNPSSNEIEYAQDIADICNAQIHYIDAANHSFFTQLPLGWRPNKPSSDLLCYDLKKQIPQTAQLHNCPVVMDGQGGDHVFLAPAPTKALVDSFLDRGFRHLTTPLKQLSTIYRTSATSLLYAMLKDTAQYYTKSSAPISNDMPYLDDDFAKKLYLHPFFLNHALKNHNPGKAEQITALYHAVRQAASNNTFANEVLIHPLLSQPIIELALKIPTYQTFSNDYDRIFFRRAVTRIKKSKSVWRLLKGSTAGSAVKSFIDHQVFIENILMNGRLANSGMINKKWLEDQLTCIKHGQSDNISPLIHLLACQLWINQWNL